MEGLVCRLGVKVRRKRVFTDFLQRVERAVCPEQGKKGIKWVFWGSAVFRTSRKGCVPVMGPRKMMRMLQAVHGVERTAAGVDQPCRACVGVPHQQVLCNVRR